MITILYSENVLTIPTEIVIIPIVIYSSFKLFKLMLTYLESGKV